MESADHQVLSQLNRWINDGEMCWLCTVVKTWGSSPRPVGSLLSCNSRGHIAGSLSGGCIEEDLLEKLQNGELAQTTPEVLIYGETQEESERFGLPCGGQLHIVIEPIPTSTYLKMYQQIVERIEQRECIERTLNIATGEIQVEEKARFKHLQINGDIELATKNGPTNDLTMVQTFGPRYQLFLIGAGQVAIYLAQMAQALDYQVVVCDPREQMIEQWPVEGVQLINAMPDDAVRQFADDRFSAIIALTHDPRIDDMGLMEALKTNAFFIGAMGSTRTSAKRRERLLQLELTEAEISKLHAPVGLSIGSKTPAEIAIAILAQLTALRSEVKVEKKATVQVA
ncbi:MAG TPA: XdhC family protein [Gammaproteobacteria bacterium]|nr:XdhC family protein [Gammaproteobacteria bacterium]HIL95754.1 XdhC family protein [Pseudomonadales bacterium]